MASFVSVNRIRLYGKRFPLSFVPRLTHSVLQVDSAQQHRKGLALEFELPACGVGAYRWQDSVGIGRPLIVVDGAFTPDLANPFFGPSQDRVDAWVGWEKGIGTYLGQNTLFRVQLNVRNLLDDTDLIPVVADPDGGISVVRISDERTFELRASLSY